MWRRLDPLGVLGAHVMSWVSLSPSLIPRTWWMTTVATGVSQGFGYLVGAGGHALYRLVRRRVARVWPDAGVAPAPVGAGPRWLSREATARLERALPWVTTAISAVAWLRSLYRQAEISGLMETRPIAVREHALGLAGGTAFGVGLIVLGRGIDIVGTATSRALRPVLPEPVAAAAGTALTGVGLTLLLNRVIYRRLLERISHAAQETNQRLLPGRRQPPEPERSGSPASAEDWEQLGAKGQAVVSDGPRAVDIEAATSAPAMPPIRAYAGWSDGRGLEETAAAVVAELHRTGGFDRSALLVLFTTGTGWLQEWSASAVEFLTGGDCALASMQYTYLPSGVALFADRTTPVRAAEALLEAIEQAWADRPPERRPRLLLGGESLGALGGTAAFEGVEEMVRRVDGAVWTGLPRFTEFWQSLVPYRRPGSPEIQPRLEQVGSAGRHVRFVTRPQDLVTGADGEDLGRCPDGWPSPRIIVAQHASDPVVWWNPRMLWRAPDWMRERVGRDVSTSVRWLPWVSFWQIASDMPRSVTAPGGHGHQYLEEMVPYWAAVLGMDPLADYSRITQGIRRLIVPSLG